MGYIVPYLIFALLILQLGYELQGSLTNVLLPVYMHFFELLLAWSNNSFQHLIEFCIF